MNKSKVLDYADIHGWVDDFGRWNFQGDEDLFAFVCDLFKEIASNLEINDEDKG
jgi:hypothetical protein